MRIALKLRKFGSRAIPPFIFKASISFGILRKIAKIYSFPYFSSDLLFDNSFASTYINPAKSHMLGFSIWNLGAYFDNLVNTLDINFFSLIEINFSRIRIYIMVINRKPILTFLFNTLSAFFEVSVINISRLVLIYCWCTFSCADSINFVNSRRSFLASSFISFITTSIFVPFKISNSLTILAILLNVTIADHHIVVRHILSLVSNSSSALYFLVVN